MMLNSAPGPHDEEVQHDPDGALSALELAIQRGLRWPMFLDDPVFQALRDDTRFVRVRQDLEALVAEA